MFEVRSRCTTASEFVKSTGTYHLATRREIYSNRGNLGAAGIVRGKRFCPKVFIHEVECSSAMRICVHDCQHCCSQYELITSDY